MEAVGCPVSGPHLLGHYSATRRCTKGRHFCCASERVVVADAVLAVQDRSKCVLPELVVKQRFAASAK